MQTPASRSNPLQQNDNFAGSGQIVYEAPSIHATLKPSFLRPTLFAVAIAAGAYGWAAYETNADTAKREKARGAGGFFGRAPSDLDLAMSRRSELLETAKRFLIRHLGNRPDTKSTKTRVYTLITEWWINKTEAQRTCLALIGVQGLVFVAWRFAPRFMAKSFTHYPLSGRSYTLLTSVFSHQSGIHFAFNSIAFYSFAPSAMAYLWQPNRESTSELRESTSRYHFIALFLAAGVLSSLASHVYTLAVKLPRALAAGAAAARSRPAVLPSLGASASIYATVVMTALAFPDTGVSLIFLPFFTLPIGVGVGGMVLADFIGLVRGWQFFDHTAHLAGALCGAFAFTLGGPFFDSLRKWISDTKPKEQQHGPKSTRIQIR